MSFNEKLQFLRKENKLSQEQLADMLDVTRQSVSKWESGTTYPEMDKLIMLCKIFKCSLDDLTNDEVVEIKLDSKKNSEGNNFINNILDIITKTVKMFSVMKFKQIVGCIFALIGLAAILCIFRIPFELLESGIRNVILSVLMHGRLSNFLIALICFILDIIYYALYIMIYVYIYKLAFLDKYEFIEDAKTVKFTNDEVVKKENVKETIREVTIVDNSNRENSLFKVLGGIALGFIKGLTALFSLPVLFFLVIIFFFLVIAIYLCFDGIFMIGVTLGLLFTALLLIWFLVLVSSFIFNRKMVFKKMLIIFLVGLVGIGISSGIVVLEVANFDYVDEPPLEVENVREHYDFKMHEKLYVQLETFYGEVLYVEDNSKTDVSVDVDYFSKIYKISFENTKDYIGLDTYYSADFNRAKILFEVVKKCLREKVFYNFDSLVNHKVTITASSENIRKIKENTKDYIKRYDEEINRIQIENYENQIINYEAEIDRLKEENSILQERVLELETLNE